MLADEGLHVYRVSSLSSRYIDFVSWSDETFIEKVTSLIVRQCGKKPVVILNDMVEQHYRKEKIPKTSFMDKSAVLSRRLNMAFPNYPIRAALKLKDSDGPTHLFAAIPQSDSYKKVMAAVNRSGAPIVGLFLLPVEGTKMVSALSRNQAKKAKTRSAWSIFVGQHRGGGLRQVVIKHGDLALTRMTPVVDTDVEADVWVKEVSAELQSTMSYLARFGYKSEDGLDVFIIANQNAKSLLEQAIDIESNLYCLDVSEASSLLGVKVGKQEDLRYADPLHTAWIGKTKKAVLPMQSQALGALTRPRKIANVVLLGLALACAFALLSAFNTWTSKAEKKDKLLGYFLESRSLKNEYEGLLRERKVEGYDYLLVNNAVEIHNSLSKEKPEPLTVIHALGNLLGPNLTVNKIEMKMEAPTNAERARAYNYSSYGDGGEQNADDNLLLTATITISFGENVDVDDAVRKVTSLEKGLIEELPDFTVLIDKQVGGLSYSESFAEEIGVNKRQEGKESRVAVIIVRQKPVFKDEEQY